MAAHPITVKPAQEVLDQVFLSPRVVDRDAYDQMTADLRALLERVAQLAKALESAAAVDQAARTAAAQAVHETLQRVTAAERQLGKALGQVAEAQALAQSAAERAARGHESLAAASAAANEHLKAFEAGCAAAVHDATSRLNTVRVDLDSRFAAVSAIAGLRLQRARIDLDAQAETVEKSASEATERSRASIADAARALDAELGPKVELLRQALADAERRADETAMRVARLSAADIEPIAELCDRLERAIGDATAARITLAKPAESSDPRRDAKPRASKRAK
ncbi:MAG: hypothetical protein ACKVW3_17415 [Phycisphaerales bacterium]